MAAHHVLRARQFAGMSETAFVASHGEVFRATSSLAGSGADNIRRIYDLHRRYSREVVAVVNQRLHAIADLDAVFETPPTSLLPILTAIRPESDIVVDAAEMEEPVSVRPEVRKSKHVRPITVVIALDERNQKVLIHGGEAIGGKCFLLVHALAARHRADTDEQTAPENFKFTRATSLLELVGAGDTAALRQQVLRARKAIADAFLRANGYDLDQDDVVQNRPWLGYRLNPFVVLVDPKQIRGRATSPASRLSDPSVTTRDADRGER
jgi:hypothetical protein